MGRREPTLTDRLIDLKRLRRRAAWVLWVERGLRALSPAFLLILSYAALAVFAVGNGWAFLGLIVLVLGSLAWEATKIRPPGAAEIDRRIEAASGLRHRPLAALGDRLATHEGLGAEIWELHQARMAAALAGARTGWPSPFAAERDPLSLRILLLLLLASGIAMAGAQAPARLAAGFTLPDWPFAGPEIDVWITPPDYAGKAPILLSPGQQVETLAGSQLSVILNGSRDAIRFGGAKIPESVLGPQSRRADMDLHQSGRLAVGPWWHRLGAWRLTVSAPAAPVLHLNPVGQDEHGLALSWTASDDYGLASLKTVIHPRGFPGALAEGAGLPAQRGAGHASLNADDSPFGGLAAIFTLQGVNLAGVSASSPPQIFTLPAARYHDTTAIALARLRQNLALAPDEPRPPARDLLALSAAPPSAISFAADVQLAALATALDTGGMPPQEAVARLLKLIRQIEAGPDYAPAQALQAASEALLQALAHGPPSADALSKLLQDMQQALARHLAAINPSTPGAPAQNFDASALNRLAAKIAADEKAGRMQQAQAEMQQLAQALQALQQAQPMSAAQAAQAQAAAQAAQGLNQLIQSQAGLLNQTTQGNATAAQQGALQQSLNGLRSQLGKAGIPNLPGMSQAGQDMQNAQNALAGRDSAGAQAAETGAIAQLQKAAAALQNASGQGFAVGPGGAPPGDDNPNGSGVDFSDPGLTLPGTNPADAIEQDIIRRDANPDLAPATHDYLRRLLAPEP